MLGAIAHPWDLSDEGAFTVCNNLRAMGFDTLLVQVKSFWARHPPSGDLPHNPERSEVISDARVYLDVDVKTYKKIKPVTASEVIRQAAEAAREADLKLYIFLNTLIDDSVVERYPGVAMVDAHGQRSNCWLCPNQPDARVYTKNLLGDALRLGVDGIIVSKAQYPPGCHYCFCDRCRAMGEKEGIDLGEVRLWLDHQDKGEGLNVGPIDPLIGYERGLPESVGQWLQWRRERITDYLMEVYELAKGRTRVGVCMQAPRSAWSVGQSYPDAEKFCDFVSPMFYLGLWKRHALESFGSRRLKDEHLKSWYRLQQYDGPPTIREFRLQGVDPSVVAQQLAIIDDLGLEAVSSFMIWDLPEEEILRVMDLNGEHGAIIDCYGWTPFQKMLAVGAHKK